jgi:hypothetical protein
MLLEPVTAIKAGDADETAAAEKDNADAKVFDLNPLTILPLSACPVPDAVLHRISPSDNHLEASQ